MSARIAIIAAEHGITDGYLIDALLAAGVVAEALILDPKPIEQRDLEIHRGRTGERLPPRPPLAAARDRIPVYRVANHNDASTAELVRQLRIDWLINAGTPRILKSLLLKAPASGVVNCHPGLLPHFRGSSAVEWALHLDEPVGNTVHLMTKGIDAGAILASEPVPVTSGDTYQDIRVHVFQAGFALMARTTQQLQRGQLTRQDAQPQTGGRYFRPISDTQFAAVLTKLAGRSYRGAAVLGSGVVE